MRDRNIKSAEIGELLRVACFFLYYIFLMGLGRLLSLHHFLFSYHTVKGIVQGCGTGVSLIILCVVVLRFLAIVLGVYLIKPHFAFKKSCDERCGEVFEAECLDVFAMIRDVASRAGCKMPKHIYSSLDVNACVFYDTNFWIVFFPVKKNLEIGLGLFDGTCVGEVKSIIAHKFGQYDIDDNKTPLMQCSRLRTFDKVLETIDGVARRFIHGVTEDVIYDEI